MWLNGKIGFANFITRKPDRLMIEPVEIIRRARPIYHLPAFSNFKKYSKLIKDFTFVMNYGRFHGTTLPATLRRVEYQHQQVIYFPNNSFFLFNLNNFRSVL